MTKPGAAFAAWVTALLLALAPPSRATPLPVTDAAYTGSVTAGSPEALTGNAALSRLTTSEGTFTNLTGAAANSVLTSNTLNSIGSVPATANAAVTGLSANDGVNNLQSGNFQFGAGFDANTRFFIVENAPQSGTLGDPATVTLIDGSNNAVGTYSLDLLANQFTSSSGGNTSNALATVAYTVTQGSSAAKLGGVTFAMADFSGTGNSSLATGIRIVSPGNAGGNSILDPNVVGIFSVSQPAVNVLFVGDSFTHGHFNPVRTYNNTNVADLNYGLDPSNPLYESDSFETGPWGGIPGIFRQFAADSGLNYSVSLEAVSSTALSFHANPANGATALIYQAKWNKVFLQDKSTEPIPTGRGGNLTSFQNAATTLEQGIHAANPLADVYLYETWARADITYPSGQAYSGEVIETMGNDLHNGYYGELALDGSFANVAPAGDAWLRAVEENVADRNPYDGIDAGKVDLWGTDSLHPSIYGAYLNALVLFGATTGIDPRTLGSEKAASDLGISGSNAISLQQIAFETLAAAHTKPVVTLTGSNPLTLEARAAYADAGATSSDVQDGMLVPVITANTVVANRPGSYTVKWVATDSLGLTGTGVRAVNVADTTAPVVSVPANVTATATSATGATVTYAAATATDAVGVTSLTYSQNSGTIFLTGTTTVTVTAADAAGNIGAGNFTVTVAAAPIAAQETLPPKVAISGSSLNITVASSVPARTYQLQSCDDLAAGLWQDSGSPRTGDGNFLIISIPYDPTVLHRFYRLELK